MATYKDYISYLGQNGWIGSTTLAIKDSFGNDIPADTDIQTNSFVSTSNLVTVQYRDDQGTPTITTLSSNTSQATTSLDRAVCSKPIFASSSVLTQLVYSSDYVNIDDMATATAQLATTTDSIQMGAFGIEVIGGIFVLFSTIALFKYLTSK